MSSVVCSTASYLINSIWEVPLIGGAGWIVSRFLKRLGPGAQHVTWVATFTLAILAPTPSLCRWFLNFMYFPAAVTAHSSLAVTVMQNSTRDVTGMVLPPRLILILFCCYLSILLYFAVRFLWSLYWTASLLRDAFPVSLKSEKDELWIRCKRSFCLEDAVVQSSRLVSGPVTVGFRRSVLLLPIGFAEQCTSHDFLAALSHECAHMKRRDFQKNLFYEAASVVIAFHPVTWMLKSQIAQTREMICDGMAVEKLIDSHAYMQSLLRLATIISVASRVAVSHAIGMFDANILEKLIMTMKAKKQNLSSAVKCGLIIPAALFLFSIAAGGAVMTVGIEPQPSQSTSSAHPYGKIYRLGKDITPPKVTHSVDAKFPKSAKKDKFQGVCVLGMIVDASGIPRDVHVTRSLRPDLDANAIRAVRQYRFKPAMRLGKPVAVAINIQVNFKLY